MENNPKQQIYKGIIDYILHSTNYTLKSIAELTNTSIKTIHSIYSSEKKPLDSKSEFALLRLYQIVLEIEATNTK